MWRPPVNDEVDAELEFHLEMRRRELMAQGMSEAQAREAALDRFGDVTRARRECRTLGHQREQRMRVFRFVSELRQDVMFAVRQFLAAPLFTIVAIATLALGIGATTATFSAIYAVVLRPLPVPAADRLMVVTGSSRDIRDMGLPNAYFLELAAEQQTFDAVAARRYRNFTVAGNEQAEQVMGAVVTGGYFDVMRVAPAIGRTFGPPEDAPGHGRVVVLSHRFWTRRFNADASVVGRDLLLNQQPFTVIGVMPPSFDFTAGSEALWVPAAWTADQRAIRDEHNLTVIGRLRDGVSKAQANQHVAAIAVRRGERQPRDRERSLHVGSLLDLYAGNYRARLFVLLAAVATVLLIGCGNVSNLLLARGAARSRELALRSALGAGTGRLVRQLLTESLVLGVSAAVAGAALARWLLQLLIAYSPAGVPRLDQARIDGTAVGFAALMAVAASIIFGLVPAWRAAGTDVTTALKEGGRGTSGGARDIVRSSLIAGEVALALVLLVVAGLLIRSAIETQRVNPGFEPQGLLTARLLLPDAKYASGDSVRQAAQRIEEAVAAIPGVQAAAVAHTVPSVRSFNNGLVPEGLPFELRYAMQCDGIFVSGGYFATVRQRLVRGRTFAPTDDNRVPPVTIVNETLARHFWPGQDAIGKRLRGASPRGLTTVIGIVEDVRAGGPAEAAPPTFYVPLSQMDDQTAQRGLFIVARSAGDPTTLGPAIRGAVSAIDNSVPLYGVVPMEERLAATLRTARFATMLLATLAAIGLVLAAVGIYGVVGYFAAQRRSEIGIRMALGATRTQVVQLVVRQALRPTLTGIVIGGIAAAMITNLIASQLVNVRPTDPATFGAVVMVLLSVAVIAALIPARRAAGLDPTRVLD